MTPAGTESDPLRVAIIGSGPAAFYVAERLFKLREDGVTVDMFERLPAPFGLVRYGVAPDHQKIKQVSRVFARLADRPGFRYFGNVAYGADLTLADIRSHFHQVCFATGAQTDRRLGIPGEDLPRSHPATAFVAWYNGHPDFRNLEFDLSVERVAVVGVGNVAVDVARILCRTPEELARTDIADYALEALRHSRVREVVMLGRRGPAQAAFSNPEIRELGQLTDTDTVVLPEEIELDPLSREAVAKADGDVARKLEILGGLAHPPAADKSRRLTIRFLVSPVELRGSATDGVQGMRLVHNRLERGAGRLKAVATERHEDLEVDMVFRSVGYRGMPLPDVPFNDAWGVIPNEHGRVTDPDGVVQQGLYVSGWIKRGPSGVIGTNKPDGKETAEAMVEDAAAGRTFDPSQAGPEAVAALVNERRPDYLSWADWQRADAIEVKRGEAAGRPRIKFTDPQEMVAQARGAGLEPERSTGSIS